MGVDTGATGKQIVFVVTLLGIFFILVMAMPSEFYVVAPDYDETNIPDYWSAEDIKNTKFWGNVTVTYDASGWSPAYLTIDRGADLEDIDIKIIWWETAYLVDAFDFWHYWYTWGWWLEQYRLNDMPIAESNVRANIDDTGNFSRYEMSCDHHNYITYFGFNETAYSSLTDALDNGEVIVTMGTDFDYEGGVLSGWDMITKLLIFQLPDVTPEINAIIALPLLTLIGFLVFVTITMIVEMLPFT